MITAIVQVETFGVASRKTGNKSVPDPAQHTTDPWTYGAGYSVRPVARAIKIKHAGLNPMSWDQ